MDNTILVSRTLSEYKDNRHSDLMQHFRGFLSGPNRCPGCAGHGITDRGTTCKACLGDGKLTSAVRGYSVTTLYGAAPVTVRPTSYGDCEANS